MSEKIKKAPSIANLTIMLFVITAITSLLLGLVNGITIDEITRRNKEKTELAMIEVMPGTDDFVKVEKTFLNSLVTAAYESSKGYVFQVSPSGFGGAIDMVVGVSLDGAITGVSIVKMVETSGLGANAAAEDFRAQYQGATSQVQVTKDGGTIDALTGATVTSRAVTDGVNAAIDAFAELR